MRRLLAYAGHICGMGLEVALCRSGGALSHDDMQRVADTMLAALHLGRTLLEVGDTAPRHPKPTKEFLAHLASGEVDE